MKIAATTFVASLLIGASTFAAQNITQCGAYFIDRSSQQIYTVNAGAKRTLGAFASQPTVRLIETYPSYTEESFQLTSGLGFLIRARSGGQPQGAIVQGGTPQFVGNCVNGASPVLDPSKIGYERYN